jgi:sulfur relay (sulfurtransferase) complex TusBCD TusD component (DsrE family)
MDKNTLILFTRAGLGDAPAELQHKLAGIFLSLVDKGSLPGVVAFYGEGVKLTCEGSPVLEQLRSFSDHGCALVVCQTCLDYFALRDRVRVGTIGGMGDIVAAMSSADKVISV